jgi:hypothetical protein
VGSRAEIGGRNTASLAMPGFVPVNPGTETFRRTSYRNRERPRSVSLDSNDCTKRQRRSRVEWTDPETQVLLRGLVEYFSKNDVYVSILQDRKYRRLLHSTRDAGSLRNKWKNLQKAEKGLKASVTARHREWMRGNQGQ